MCFMSNVGVAGFPPEDQVSINYTGKNINSTDLSRTANVTDLQVGDVLVMDPYGFDKGVGTDFGNPTTGHLSNAAMVVVRVPSDSLRGGPCWAVPLTRGCCIYANARTKANMTAGTTALILTNDTDGSANLRHLVASTTVNSALTATGIKGIAAETVDTSSTAAVKKVMPAY